MTRLGAELRRKPEVEEPVEEHAPVIAYVLERDGPGWRASILELPAAVAVRHVKTTYEPDLKGLAIDKIMRHIEERAK